MVEIGELLDSDCRKNLLEKFDSSKFTKVPLDEIQLGVSTLRYWLLADKNFSKVGEVSVTPSRRRADPCDICLVAVVNSLIIEILIPKQGKDIYFLANSEFIGALRDTTQPSVKPWYSGWFTWDSCSTWEFIGLQNQRILTMFGRLPYDEISLNFLEPPQTCVLDTSHNATKLLPCNTLHDERKVIVFSLAIYLRCIAFVRSSGD